MPDILIKKRYRRAIRRAAEILKSSNYEVMFLNNGVFNIEAYREREIRKIRIVLDEISDFDKGKVESFRLPEICTKEIWCKKFNQAGFEIREVN